MVPVTTATDGPPNPPPTPEEQPPQDGEPITLTLTYDKGHLGVKTNTGDIILLYGLLESAKAALTEDKRQRDLNAAANTIIPAHGRRPPLDLFRR